MTKRRPWAALVVALCMLGLACRLPTLVPRGGSPSPGTQGAATAVPPTALAPTATEIPPAQPTFTPTPIPSRTPVPTLSPTAVPPADPHLSPDDVLIFPWPLHEGDQISVDVDPGLAGLVEEDQFEGTEITLAFDNTGPITTAVSPQGLDGSPQARFYWTAELTDTLTNGAEPGGFPATVFFTITLVLPEGVVDPDLSNNTVVLPVEVQPREALPPPELGAQWMVTETSGFRLHYVSGAAAERDLVLILNEAQAAYAAVTARLEESDEPVDIYLLDRAIGQGGYASSEWVAITYTDRSYVPVVLSSVLRHELTHRLDDAIGCDAAPTVVREGLAVYLGGGHYRPEPLRQKATALLTTSHYIPLEVLVDDFYTHQHEVAYLQAGAVIAYIADTHGWDALVEACRATEDVEGDDPARWEAFAASLALESAGTLEQDWQTWLRRTPEGTGATYDPSMLELELRLMDAMRAYQALYDPAAHFMRGILFSPAEAKRLEIVADFVRRPRDPVSIGFELVVAMGQEAVEQRDVTMLALLVEDLELALTEGPDRVLFVRDAIEIAELALSQDWEPSHLRLTLGTYTGVDTPDEMSRSYLVDVVDRLAWPEQSILSAHRVRGEWELQGVSGVP